VLFVQYSAPAAEDEEVLSLLLENSKTNAWFTASRNATQRVIVMQWRNVA